VYLSVYFEREIQVIEEVSRTIQEANGDHGVRSVLVICINTASLELSDFKGHLFGGTDRAIAHNIDVLNTGSIRHLFLPVYRVRGLVKQLKSTQFRLIAYQAAVMQVLDKIKHTAIEIFATRSEFQNLKTRASECLSPNHQRRIKQSARRRRGTSA
jgi:hypothetical protein